VVGIGWGSLTPCGPTGNLFQIRIFFVVVVVVVASLHKEAHAKKRLYTKHDYLITFNDAESNFDKEHEQRKTNESSAL
jgi:hypothetical protein